VSYFYYNNFLFTSVLLEVTAYKYIKLLYNLILTLVISSIVAYLAIAIIS